MDAEDHADTALAFLDAADREFAQGDDLQASEKLWGAASHAVMAVVQRDTGMTPKSHEAMRHAVTRMARERDNALILEGYRRAEDFHKNFYHRLIETGDERDEGRRIVRQFVNELLPRAPKVVPAAKHPPRGE